MKEFDAGVTTQRLDEHNGVAHRDVFQLHQDGRWWGKLWGWKGASENSQTAVSSLGSLLVNNIPA